VSGAGCGSATVALATILSLTGLISGCHKVEVQESAPPPDELTIQPPPDDAGPLSKAPKERPARCPKAGASLGLGDATAKDAIEVGGALEYEGGYAVGFASLAGARRRAAVARFGVEASGPGIVVELGPVVDDAPPPLLARRSRDLLAAVFGLAPSRADKSRELTVYAVGEHAAVALASFDKPADDSLASDMASDGRDAFVVWDEALGVGRGVVRGALVAQREPRPEPPHDISPQESDAGDPRVLADGAGYTVLWIARSPEGAGSVDASEVPGETRVFSWVQGIDLDARGVARGPARDLTPRGGHVSAFDAKMFGEPGSLVLVARDDGEASDGSGGTLLRVQAHGAGVDAVQTLPVDGVGRGAPFFVDGNPPWLSWVGRDEQVRLLPLDPGGAPNGLASAEETLSEARPLAVWSSPGGGAKWLIASPSDPAGPLRAVSCALAHGL
jgi:hypothetical protein